MAAKKKVKEIRLPDEDPEDAPAAGKDLLIVESPAKVKTIRKFLGSSYMIRASYGHVRDIPSRGRGIQRIGIDIAHRYKPTYAPIPGREKVLKDLEAAAAKARLVYLAPDPDREGEAIAWHIQEALDLPEERVRRVTFNAITKRAVQEALANPAKLNLHLVNAQQGRRVLDRLVGFTLSPFLWKKVTKGLSAGRVQSVAVRLVVEREREIRAFRPEEFWKILADLLPAAGEQKRFRAQLVEWKGRKFGLGEAAASGAESAQAVAAALRAAPWTVDSVAEREVKGRPGPPFITSTLQQAASTFLRFGAVRTMRLAQDLYEGVELENGQRTGLITYMRTDSTRITPEGLAEARDYIDRTWGPAYLPEKPAVYTSRAGAQDAHEAIRPTSVALTPDAVASFLQPDQLRLYDLIWRRFLASQMNPAVYQTTTAVLRAADGLLEAKGRRVVFDGHTVLGLDWRRKRKEEKDEAEKAEIAEEQSAAGEEADEDQLLPALAAGDRLALQELEAKQHFTQPPPRFSEASLVRALEKEGIGRPSTYAPIVQTIQERGYVRLESRRFFATELGTAVTDILLANFPEILDVGFTAGMEADLDHVEEGKVEWADLVDRFYKPFSGRLEKAMAEAEPLKGRPAPNGEVCPLCGAPTLLRYSQNGAFLGCTRYPECKGTIHMPGEFSSGLAGDTAAEPPPACPICDGPTSLRRSRFGPFLGCMKYPECKGMIGMGRDGRPMIPPKIVQNCEYCGKAMIVRGKRRGFDLTCPDPACRNVKPIDKNGVPVNLPRILGVLCEKCGAEMVVRLSRRGPFLSCSAFPKCRHAKPLPKEGEDAPAPEAAPAAEDAAALEAKPKPKRKRKTKAED